MKKIKKIIALLLNCAIVLSVISIAAFAFEFSDSVYKEYAPADIMKVNENEDKDILNGATAAANTTALSFLGINVTSTDAAGALNSASDPTSPLNLLVFGSEANENPDPYLWNFYYNLNKYGYPGDIYDMEDYYNAGWTGAYTLLNNAKSGPTGQGNTDNSMPIGVNGSYKYCDPVVFYAPDVLMGASEDSYNLAVANYQLFYNPIYNPLPLGNWGTGDGQYAMRDETFKSTETMANGVYTYALEIEQYLRENEINKVSRYDNDEIVQCGVDYSSFALGLYYYLEACEENKSLQGIKYCTGVTIGENETYTITNDSSITGRMKQYLDGIAVYVDEVDDNDPFNSVEELKKVVDVIITDTSKYTYTQIDNFEAAGIQVIDINGDFMLPSTVYGTTMQSADNILGLPYMFGLLYSDQLKENGIDIGADDFTAYFVENLYHVKSDAVNTVLDAMYGNGRGWSHSADYTSVIDSMIEQGARYYHNNYEGSEKWLAADDDLI